MWIKTKTALINADYLREIWVETASGKTLATDDGETIYTLGDSDAIKLVVGALKLGHGIVEVS